MSAKSLTQNERMMLQVGTMMQVQIVGEDENGLQAAFVGTKDTKQGQTPTASTSQPTPAKTSRRPSSYEKKVSVAKGPMLHSLKTGMKLDGIVTHSTPYAAFVSANVYRQAKKGLFAEVRGMLHKSELLPEVAKQLEAQGRMSNKNIRLIEPGTKLTVYVREVYKNNG